MDVTSADGTRLEKKLRSRENTFIDELVYLGNDSQPVRLVGFRADDSTASKRRRERKQTAEKFGNQPRHQSLVRDGWHLMITSLDQTHPAQNLYELYALRWNIETRFKAWKQSLQLKQTLKRYTNIHHLESIALAGLIHMLLTNHVYRTLRANTKRIISLEKLSDVITSYFKSLKNNDLKDKTRLRIGHVIMALRKHKSLEARLLTL